MDTKELFTILNSTLFGMLAIPVLSTLFGFWFFFIKVTYTTSFLLMFLWGGGVTVLFGFKLGMLAFFISAFAYVTCTFFRKRYLIKKGEAKE